MKESQKSQILVYLKSGRSLTSMEALVKFGSFRLGARIKNLRDDGHNIETKIIETAEKKRIARYRLI